MIRQMSDQLDPSRLCTKEMPHAEVALVVNYLADCKFTDEWQFGKEPYSRDNPQPVVSCFRLYFDLACISLQTLILLAPLSRILSRRPLPAP